MDAVESRAKLCALPVTYVERDELGEFRGCVALGGAADFRLEFVVVGDDRIDVTADHLLKFRDISLV